MNAKTGRVARNMYRPPNGGMVSEIPRLIRLMIDYATGFSTSLNAV